MIRSIRIRVCVILNQRVLKKSLVHNNRLSETWCCYCYRLIQKSRWWLDRHANSLYRFLWTPPSATSRSSHNLPRTKKSVLVLVLQMLMLCCEIRSCYGRRHNAGHSSFQVRYCLYFLYSVLGTTLLWRSTVAFTNLKVKSTKCLCLLPTVLVLVLVLLFWSWSCKQRSWS